MSKSASRGGKKLQAESAARPRCAPRTDYPVSTTPAQDQTILYAVHNVAGAPAVVVQINGILTATLSPGEVFVLGRVPTGTVQLRVSTEGGAELYNSPLIVPRGKLAILNLTGQISVESGLILLPQVISVEDCCPQPGAAIVHLINGTYGVESLNFVTDELLPYKVVAEDVRFGAGGARLVVAAGTVGLGAVYPVGSSVFAPIVSQSYASGGVYVAISSGLAAGAIEGSLNIFQIGDCETYASPFQLDLYLGRWFQIAWTPQVYGRGCERQVAQYTLGGDGNVVVNNFCYTKDFHLISTITGFAIQSSSQPAALTVVFPPQEAPLFPNYLVHAVGRGCEPLTPYTYAVVGSPDRTSFYILSRKATMSQKKYQKLLRFACALGYNIDNIVADSGAVGHDRCAK